MLILGHHEVRDILARREPDVLAAVRSAYMLHDAGSSTLPHSTFLRLPGAGEGVASPNRIIGLPAYLGGEAGTAGMKWIASFPGNPAHGLERASAVMVLNSLETGRPEALIEASLISSARTAASAALAAGLLLPSAPEGAPGVTMIGCGVINLAILRYLRVVLPALRQVTLYDHAPERANDFARALGGMAGLDVTVMNDRDKALGANDLVSVATTASVPHMALDEAPAGATVLHVSLRDLTPETILSNHNVTDDVDHVCRERTSLHLAEQVRGDRSFIDGSLGGVLRAREALTRDGDKALIFSPFGLGVLDLAVARLVCQEAVAQGRGVTVDSFLPGVAV